MKINKKRSLISCCCLLMAFLLVACSGSLANKSDSPLDPEKPVTVTLWHYNNGYNKEIFDLLVEKYNESQGMEKGIVVEAISYGDVQQLAQAVYDSASKGLGASLMPDIFGTYADNAFRVNQIQPLVTLDQYFSEKELASFRKEFLDEGAFLSDGKYRILPVAKATENLFLNKTLWDKFAKETGADIAELSSWEGIARIAESYYEHTGKGFFGIDSWANFMIIAAMQDDQEIYVFNPEDQSGQLNFTEEYAKKVWDYGYSPFLKGHFVKEGRFSSDDAKTGEVIAYIGSTAGAAYFPREVSLSKNEVLEIEGMTLPYPVFANGKPYVIQQGAGMSIVQSDYQHEYAAAEFLKWFTEAEQNLFFAVSTGYLPVTNQALEEDVLLKYLEESGKDLPGVKSSLKTSSQMLKTYTMYSSKPFKGSLEVRNMMEDNLLKKRDLFTINDFEKWYNDFKLEARKILNN